MCRLLGVSRSVYYTWLERPPSQCLIDGNRLLRLIRELHEASGDLRQVCRNCRLAQDFITSYTPQRTGLIERLFCSLKEVSVWQHQFSSFEED